MCILICSSRALECFRAPTESCQLLPPPANFRIPKKRTEHSFLSRLGRRFREQL